MKPAETHARNLLLQYNMLDFPIDVFDLAERMGIPVSIRILDEGVSGVLVVNNGRATIGINEDHPHNRRRFTLAHELGHYILHRPKSGIFVDRTLTFRRDRESSNGSTFEEIQANAFAAELLMPEAELRGLLENLDLYDPNAVAQAASWLEVSEQALTIRLMSLGFVAG